MNDKYDGQDVGKAGELLVNEFIDSKLAKIFSFTNPTTADNAEVADILIWMNWLGILIEVKTRGEGDAPIQNWVRSKIQESIEQVEQNFNRIKENEIINLHNEYYDVQLDCENISQVIGLVILVFEDNCPVLPSTLVPEIYSKSLPIHVFTLDNLGIMAKEIDTVSDLFYYLEDRFTLIQNNDIPIGSELEALGYYKSHDNGFPDESVDFLTTSYWNDYQTDFERKIDARDKENLDSGWIDKLEEAFTLPRKLFDDIPKGLYYAWEVGSLDRRTRTIIGQKMESVHEWFSEGNTSRKFAFENPSTGNWLVFLFLKGNSEQVQIELAKLNRLKLIIEVNNNNFKHAIYGFGFQVSESNPPHIITNIHGEINRDNDILEGKFTEEEVIEAGKIWGDHQSYEINEFPNSSQ